MVGDRRATLIAFLILCSLLVSLQNIVAVGAAEGYWKTLEPIPTLRENFEIAVLNGKIYAIGGSNSSQQVYFDINEEYDPASNTWDTKESMPTPRSGFGTFVFQDRIYCISGYSTETSYIGVNEVYDPVSDSWEIKTSMPTKRSSMQTKIVNRKIFFLGGAIGYDYEKSETIYSQSNEAYDPVADSWETRTSIPVNGEFDAHVFDDKIYCVFKDSIWVYDTKDDSWTQKASMLIPAVYNYYTVVVENRIYFLLPSEGCYNQIYDLQNDTWSFGENVPIELKHPTIVATTGNFAPQRIYMIGGATGLVEPTNTTYMYDPTEDKWSLGTSMTTSRYGTHVVMVNDILYAIGGAIGFLLKPTGITSAVEKYTPTGYIPEFPSWTPLLITLVALVALAVVYRHGFHKQSQRRGEE